MEPVTELVMRELQQLRSDLLPLLPMPYVFVVQHPAFADDILFVTHELAEPRHGWPPVTFDGPEVQALAVALYNERLTETEFLGYCGQKLVDASLRVSAQDMLAGACATQLPMSAAAMFNELRLRPIHHGPWSLVPNQQASVALAA